MPVVIVVTCVHECGKSRCRKDCVVEVWGPYDSADDVECQEKYDDLFANIDDDDDNYWGVTLIKLS